MDHLPYSSCSPLQIKQKHMSAFQSQQHRTETPYTVVTPPATTLGTSQPHKYHDNTKAALHKLVPVPCYLTVNTKREPGDEAGGGTKDATSGPSVILRYGTETKARLPPGLRETGRYDCKMVVPWLRASGTDGTK